MPTRKPARRARRSAPHWRLPALEQRQLDLIGLGLVALGLFFAFLVYFGWDGGRAGSQAVEGLRWLLGAGHYLVPVAVCAAGAILMLRPMLPAVRPFRSGAICVFAAVTLGLAAGTIGPGGHRPGWWDAAWVKTRGGMVGETLDWAVTTLAGTIGAHILALFLLLAGVLLLTGASVAGVLKATHTSVSSTTREMRDAVATRRPRPRPASDLETLEQSMRVRVERPDVFGETPEFETPEAKRAAKPKPAEDESFWSGEDRYPDLYGGEPPEPEPQLEAEEPEAEPEVEAVPELERLAEDPPEDEEGVTRGPAEPVDPADLT